MRQTSLKKQSQTLIPEPCEQKNGGCQQICLPQHTVATCDCYLGYILGTDKKTCYTGKHWVFLALYFALMVVNTPVSTFFGMFQIIIRFIIQIKR